MSSDIIDAAAIDTDVIVVHQLIVRVPESIVEPVLKLASSYRIGKGNVCVPEIACVKREVRHDRGTFRPYI